MKRIGLCPVSFLHMSEPAPTLGSYWLACKKQQNCHKGGLASEFFDERTTTKQLLPFLSLIVKNVLVVLGGNVLQSNITNIDNCMKSQDVRFRPL
jgi:hypothetical protein